MSVVVGPRRIPSPLLLDTYPNAAVAYSLRKLRTAYTGNAIRVRRSIDNAEQDISFVGNDLDTASMLDFVGYNIWTYSEDISQTVYSNSRSTETINSITAPDGNLTGGKVIEDLTFGEHGLNRVSGIIVNATDYTTSAYFKQAERTKIRIFSNISGANQQCDLDLTNGTVSNSTFSNTPVVTAEANGWYRFSVTITSGTISATNGMTFRLFNASNVIAYTGDGTSGCYVWGYQLSQTSEVKPYQKTVATAGGAGFVTTWYDQSGNTNDAIMPTNVNQPIIVSNGTLIEEDNKPAIGWVSNDSLVAPSINELHNGTKCFVAAVVKSNLSSTVRQSIIATSQNFTSNRGYTLYLITNPGIITSNIFNGTTTRPSSNTTNSDYPNGSRYLVTDIIDADESLTENRSILNINDGSDIKNNTLTGTPTVLDSTRGLMIGYQNTDSYFRGTMQEIVIYTNDQSSNRTDIKNNINTHYSIY